MRMATLLRTLVAGMVVATAPLHAQTVPERAPIAGAWGPNGVVNDSVVVGDTLFIGGGFDYVGPSTGPFATVDGDDGRNLNAWQGTADESLAATPDGSGGWFVGVRPLPFVPTYYVRHVRADGSTDPAFESVAFSAYYFGLAYTGGRLYVHGGFASVGGTTRQGLVALDPTTGLLLAWDPEIPGAVIHAAADGGVLFISGDFTSVGGQPRNGMAALDADTGALLPATFTHSRGGGVVQVQASGGRVYARGGCDSPSPTNLIASVCAYLADGTPLPNWGDGTTEYFGPMLATPARVYIGASASVPGGFEYRVRGFDPVTGRPDGWRSPPLGQSHAASIASMATAGARIYVSGDFAGAGPATRSRFAAFDTTTGALSTWQPAVSAAANALVSDGARIALTGRFRSTGGMYVSSLAALDLATGRPRPLPLPSMPGPVTALAASGSLVVAGAGSAIVAFSATTGTERARLSVSAAGAPPGTVSALAIAEPTLFVGGNFVDLLGQPRRHLGAIDMRTGLPTPFDPQPDDQVYRLRVSSGAVYAVGAFRTVPGYARAGVAAWDLATGALEPFSPPDVGTHDLAFYRDRVLLAGDANHTGASGTAWAGRVVGDLLTLGRPVPYTAWTATRIGDTIVVGGYASPGWPNAGLSALDAVSGALLPWSPQITAPTVPAVYHVQTAPSAVIVTGAFSAVDGRPAHNLAIFPIARAATPTQMSAAVAGNTLSLGWLPGRGPAASGYVVELGVTAGGSEVGTFPVGTLTRVTGTLPSGTFYARVRGVSLLGAGAPGSEVVVTVPPAPVAPSAPTALIASVAAGEVVLQWTAAAGNATEYVIEAGRTPGANDVVVRPTGHLDTVLTTAAPPGAYYVRVRAANAFGVSDPSNELVVVVP